ncbi:MULTISPECIES: Druantia anti-phage system protein DruA [Thiorhodovibrio]|uniref:Druantia anti-phage system protein DruA n=1 Tax=Thiorhodovibrio TaxID=61593 RepID=UPI0019145B89|nr:MULTISPECIES: Druantia anti-phage system protein DruA [Thiorhodovibrio]MBK5971109.1 hypothetical protein [Thiorhodovibrio winogradskyi]WPL10523.1 hypothetical protein Thiosp_00238 [Thiorhodovibrio litoralis]
MIVPIRPPLDGACAERFLAFSRCLARTQSADESAREALLADEIGWARDALSSATFAFDTYEAAVRVLADLHRLGWQVRESGYGIELSMQTPRIGGLSPAQIRDEKARTRALFRPAVQAQLGDPAVRSFVARMEKPSAKSGKRPITQLITEGPELHGRLTTTTWDDATPFEQLPIQPYLQLVTKDATDAVTGQNLREIWRYFRFTWSIPQFATPGRQLLYLVRDAAHPCHAVMGLLGLNNSALQMGEIREAELGWSRAVLIARLKTITDANQLTEEFNWLESCLSNALQDVETEALATSDEIAEPSAEVIARLRRHGQEFDHWRDQTLRQLKVEKANGHHPATAASVEDARGYPPVSDAVLDLEPKPSGNPRMQQARRFLVARKRATLLAELLQARQTLRRYRAELTDPRRLPAIIEREEILVALQTVLDSLKSRYAGINILEVSTCGAIPPYNLMLGGKLAALLLFSPRIAADYRRQYAGPSIIASQLKNAPVQRDATLVYLATTSLYAHGSSQYERVRLPACVISEQQDELRFRRLGMTSGYGTMQFLDETRAAIERFLLHQQGFEDINSIFGEGPSPKLRLFTAGMTRLGFRPDELMSHHQRRLIYGISLAPQSKEFLSGRPTQLPDYLLEPERFQSATRAIARYWTNRWLSSRLSHSESLTALLVQSAWRLGDRLPVIRPPEETEMSQPDRETDQTPASQSTASGQDFWLQIAAAGPKTVSDALTLQELDKLHIDFAIESFVAAQVADGRSLFLTGNAGDGKTHILRKLAPRLKKAGAVVVEDATACMRRNQIEPVIERWRDAERDGRPFCIAINEYPLHLLRIAAKAHLPELAAELARQSQRPLIYGENSLVEEATPPLFVVDLSLRNPLNPAISAEMLDRILMDQWITETSSLEYNKTRLADPVVKRRLMALFQRLVNIGVRVTMRELWILLARLVLGYRGDLKEPLGSNLEYRYTEVLFSSDARFTLGQALQFCDPARYSHPIWDSLLEDRHETTLEGWNFGPPVINVADRPDRKVFQALKRSFYFEHDSGDACFSLEDSDVAEFQKVLRSSVSSNLQVKRQLVHGLNRAFCVQEFPGCEDNLYLWNGHRFHEKPSRSFLAHRFIPVMRLELLQPQIPPMVAEAFPEYEPDHLVLACKTGNEFMARLKIDFPLFCILQRLRRGLPRKLLPESEAFRLDAFMEALNSVETESDSRVLSAHLERKELLEVELNSEANQYRRVSCNG